MADYLVGEWMEAHLKRASLYFFLGIIVFTGLF